MSKTRQRPLKGLRRDGYAAGKFLLHREILEALGYQCNRCGKQGKWPVVVLHHRNRNRADNSPDNLEPLCTACHAKEHHAESKAARAAAAVLPHVVAARLAGLKRAHAQGIIKQARNAHVDACWCGRRKEMRNSECAACRNNERRRQTRKEQRLEVLRREGLWREL